MDKISIMHVVPSLEAGGMEKGVLNLVNGMNREIFRPLICCLERQGSLAEKVRKDVKIYNLKQRSGLRFSLSLKLMRLFRREKVKIVHTHNFSSSLYGIIAARLARVPVIIQGEHGLIMQDKRRRRQIGKYLSCFADCVVTVSRHLRNALVHNFGIRADGIATILNGIDLNTVGEDSSENSAANERKRCSGDLVIGTVGRLVPVKDHKTLILAFSIALKSIPNSKLFLIGDGPLRRRLESMAVSLGLEEKIVFLGESRDVDKELKLMDVFALSSLSEGMSNVILEAMAAKLPVVATNVGDNSELVRDGETGVLVPAAEPTLLASAIVDILSDLQKARDMGKAGYQHLKRHFGLYQMIGRYEELYKYWLGKKGVLSRP